MDFIEVQALRAIVQGQEAMRELARVQGWGKPTTETWVEYVGIQALREYEKRSLETRIQIGRDLSDLITREQQTPRRP
jgi:hypothetical protein